MSCARLTVVEPACLSETCLKWQRRSNVLPNARCIQSYNFSMQKVIAWIQECGEKPMFHFQSQWSPETHLLPVRLAVALRNRMKERTSQLA